MSLKDELEKVTKESNYSYSVIAVYLLNLNSYSHLKIKDISECCHVSGATVVRFCKHLGYNGFAELKYCLTNELGRDRKQFVTDLQQCRENPVYYQMVEIACKRSEELFTEEKQEKFLTLLDTCKEIILIGLGTSYLMAKDFEIRFGRIGLKCRAIDDIMLQRFAIKNATEESLIIAFCYSGTTRAVMDNVKLAKAKKAKVIFWTCDMNTQFEEKFDLTVYIHSSEPNHMRISTTSRMAILFLIDMIYFTYVNTKGLKLENYTDVYELSEEIEDE